MAINDVLTLHAQWRITSGSLTAENQFHFQQTGVLVFDEPGEDLVQMYRDIIEPSYLALVSSVWGIVNYKVNEQPSGLTVYEQTVPDFSGGLSGDSLPPQVATILSYKSAHPGRSGKGRVYLPPANEASSTIQGMPGTTLGTLVTDLVDALLAAVDDVAYAGWKWGIWSEKEQMFYPATHGVPRFRFATQRSRAR